MINWLHQIFTTSVPPALLVEGQYEPLLVILSILLASSASFFALRLAETARHIVLARYRHIATATGALILAGGIWSMHFVGMLAFKLPHVMTYDWFLTVLSVIPAFVASLIVLKSLIYVQEKDALSISLTARNGVIVGAGIGAMHYTGMAAMDMHLTVKYNPNLFVLSIVVAVGLACVALLARRAMKLTFPNMPTIRIKLIIATIMGLAISGMHYTGMAATYFIASTSEALLPPSQTDSSELAYAVSIFSFLIFLLAMNVSSQLRYRQLLIEQTANEARTQAILDTATDAVFTINDQGRIQEFNAAAQSMFGWTECEAHEQSIEILFPEKSDQQYDGFLVDYFLSAKSQVVGTNRELVARNKKGELFPIQLGVGRINLPNGELLYVGFASDISHRKEMEERVTKSEDRLSSLIRNIPGVSFRCLLDEDWTPLFLSEAIYDLNGHTASEYLEGKLSFGSWLHPEDHKKVTRFFEQAIGVKDRYELEYRVTHKNGNTLWVLETGTIVYDEAKEAKWIDGVMLDITSRKAMEQELRESKFRAEEAAEAKASFLANMSHEIRTPMNAIIGFSSILLDSSLPTETRKHLQTINHSAQSLLHLLNDILDSAKLDKNKLELDMKPFRLSSCVDTVISTLWLQAKNKGLTLDLEVNADLPQVVEGAEDRIRQVLINLVGNGIKFTESGSVSLKVCPVPERHEWIRFAVRDTGIGISQERVDSIFDAFTQADSSMSRRFGGTGLGTTISKQLVELMGGTIHLDSRLGEGSCFYFDIPLPIADKNDLAPTHQLLQLPALRVLVADDIEENLTLLNIMLSKQGHAVYLAKDGLEAVEVFKDVRPDIVLMDIQMPNMDGLEATHIIRTFEQKAGLEKTPIIALTASVLLEDRVEAQEAGMSGFANKPVDLLQLMQEMAKVLELDANDLATVMKSEAFVGSPKYRVVHLGKGMELWGEYNVYVSEIIKFYKKNQGLLIKLQTYIAQKDWVSLSERAHALKGLTGNLALLPLYHHFTMLEKAANNHQISDIAASITQISIAWQELAEDIQSLEVTLTPITNEINDEEGDFSIQEQIELLTEWLYITESGEIDDELTQKLLSSVRSDIEPLVRQAAHHVDEFEFKEAVKQIYQARTLLRQ